MTPKHPILVEKRRLRSTATAVIIVLALGFQVRAQNTEPSIKFNLRTYICYKSADSLTIDGKLNEQSWKKAKWTDFFLNIKGSERPRPRYKTRVKMLWDDTYLYIGNRMEEPDVWTTLTRRDAIIFHDNAFEFLLILMEIHMLTMSWNLMPSARFGI